MSRSHDTPGGGMCLTVIIMAVVVAASIFLLIRGCGKAHAATVRNELALRKCRLIVRECYPDSGFWPWCGTLIAKHEWYAQKKNAPEFAAAWWDSLTYGAANFGLRVGATAPGWCSGPMDVKSTNRTMHRRMIRDTGANIHAHVSETWLGYSRGYRGRGLCEYVMLPSVPRDYGGGKFRRTDARHRAVIAKAYKEGLL